jgi:hypothetical protein
MFARGVAVLAVSAFAGPALADTVAISASGSAPVISKVVVASNDGGSTITVGSDGAISSTGAVLVLHEAATSTQTFAITCKGACSRSIRVTISASATSGPANSRFAIQQFIVSGVGAINPGGSFTISNPGGARYTFSLGMQLNMKPGAATGGPNSFPYTVAIAEN